MEQYLLKVCLTVSKVTVQFFICFSLFMLSQMRTEQHKQGGSRKSTAK
jgi:hypothetical protein